MHHGKELEKMFDRTQLSQQKAADIMGVTRLTLTNYFKREVFKKRILRTIAKAPWVDLTVFGFEPNALQVSESSPSFGEPSNLELLNEIKALHRKLDAVLEAKELS